jgi:aminoglycoside 6'-N-acetyltransferase
VTDAGAYHFRPVIEADLPLLALWRARPHVVEWWSAPVPGEIEEALVEPQLALWIVEHEAADGTRRPFAFAQDYAPGSWDNHPFAYLPPGSRGIDQYIGEPDMIGRGHGSAFVRQHCARLFAEGAPAVGTDPNPDNGRAIRAYEKAGFAIVSPPLDTRWGRAVLMENWNSRSGG